MDSAAVDLSGSRELLWNDRKVLRTEFIPPEFSCIGKVFIGGGFRCPLELVPTACFAAKALLDDKTYLEGRPQTGQLYKLALVLHCAHHQYQAYEKTREWAMEIRQSRQGFRVSTAKILPSNTNIQAIRKQLDSMKTVPILSAAKYSGNSKTRPYFEPSLSGSTAQNSAYRGASPPLDSAISSTRFSTRSSNRFSAGSSTRYSAGSSTRYSTQSSARSEESKKMVKSQCTVEELSILTQEIISIFADEETLQPIYSSAMKNPSIDATQFESSFRRFLISFAKDLGNEAREANQKNVALVIQICADDFAISISSQVNDEDIISSERIQRQKLDSADSVKLLMLSHYLSSNEARETRSPLISKNNSDSHCLPKDTDSATDVDRNRISGILNSAHDFSNVILPLTEVKQLVVQSKAFDTFRQQLDGFVHLDHDAVQNLFASAISYGVDNNRVVKFTPCTMIPHPGIVDQIKVTLEKWIRNPVIWWPLQPPRTWCLHGYTRISWACVSSSSELLRI